MIAERNADGCDHGDLLSMVLASRGEYPASHAIAHASASGGASKLITDKSGLFMLLFYHLPAFTKRPYGVELGLRSCGSLTGKPSADIIIFAV